MEYHTFEDRDDLLIDSFTRRVLHDDHNINPSWAWSRDSPNQHLLTHGNLHPPGQRPPLAYNPVGYPLYTVIAPF